MFHLRIMLRQMLTIEEIPNIKEWEETLLRLSLQIARDLTFTTLPHRQGEDMDVRQPVKRPRSRRSRGGSPSDSEYVDGAVANQERRAQADVTSPTQSTHHARNVPARVLPRRRAIHAFRTDRPTGERVFG